MPISVIGKTRDNQQEGYTLIEVLAVLIILAFIGLMAYPRFSGIEERTYLIQIGKLVRADLKTVKDEAFCGKTEIDVIFFENGYAFNIGEVEIRRVFEKYQFHWETTIKAIEKTDTTESFETLTEDETELEPDNSGISFSSDKDLQETTINWTSSHYQGSIQLQTNGNVVWSYNAK